MSATGPAADVSSASLGGYPFPRVEPLSGLRPATAARLASRVPSAASSSASSPFPALFFPLSFFEAPDECNPPICNRASRWNLLFFSPLPWAVLVAAVAVDSWACFDLIPSCTDALEVVAVAGSEAPEVDASGGGARPEAGSRLEDARTISWYALTMLVRRPLSPLSTL